MSVLQSLNYQGGVYDMTLILGSFSAKSGLSYPIGAVRIALPKPDETGYVAGPKAGPAGAGAQDPADYAVKPEIRHVFRPDAKQAPFVVSATFTGVVFVPWLVLLIGVRCCRERVCWKWLTPVSQWQQLGFGVPLLTRLSFVTQSLFAAAILALPAIMFLYWTAWNLFQLLPYLAGWGVYAFYTGRRALREHAAFRAKNESGKAKKSE